MLIEALKAFLIGIVEGITEWLPISSTGHMILVDEFVRLQVSPAFLELFLVVIQLGAVLAVVILYFRKLNPFARTKTRTQRRGTWRLWGMVLIGCIPAAVVGGLFDEWFDEYFHNAVTVSIALVAYGVAFILIERRNRRESNRNRRESAKANFQKQRGRHAKPSANPLVKGEEAALARGASPAISTETGYFKINSVDEIDPVTALKIGLFQVLAIVPGTSRSGSTIIGAMLTGCSRVVASEFSFFLAIPVMLGWGMLKTLRYLMKIGFNMSQVEGVVFGVGIITATVVSVLAIKFLLGYVKKHDFTAFGWYRIVVGIIVLGFFGTRYLGVF